MVVQITGFKKHPSNYFKFTPARVLFSIFFFSLVSVVMLGSVPLAVAQAATKDVTFQASTADIANPERGFMKNPDIWVDQPLDPTKIRAEVSSDTLVWIYFHLDNYRDPRDGKGITLTDYQGKLLEPLGSGKGLDTVKAAFDTARSKGLKLVIRFRYVGHVGIGSTSDLSQTEPDAPLELVQQHLAQLKPLLEQNKDVIAAVQTGFVGYWGEWHSSKYLGSLTNRKAVTDAVLAAVPKDRMIMLRYPRYKQLWYGGPLTESQAFNQSDLARIGHHDDAFLKDDTDDGTFKSNTAGVKITTYCDGYPGGEAQCWRDYVNKDTRFTAVGGEASVLNSPRSDCPNAVTQMENMHWSFINNVFNKTVHQSWIDQGCMPDIRKRLGYRFVLQKVTVPTTVSVGSPMSFYMEVKNEGFASMYNDRPVYLVFENMTTGLKRTQQLIGIDPRRWLPVASQAVNVVNTTLTVPAGLTTGAYKLYLWLPDAASTLQNNSAYAVQLANSGTWQATTGYNFLTDNIQVSASGSTPPPATATPTPTNLFPGDTNGDMKVDLADLSAVLSNFGKTPATRLQGNVAGNDNLVNLTDLSAVLSNYGNSSTPSPTATPTILVPTATPTRTPTPLVTNTPTRTPTLTPTRTPTPTGPTNTPTPTGTGGQVSTDANLKVAFIGDSGAGTNFQKVLDFINVEGADIVIHSGDLDYKQGDLIYTGPEKWRNMVNTTLGSNFPYLASDGNHDNWVGDGYYDWFANPSNANSKINLPNMIQKDTAGANVGNYSVTYRGLKMVFTGDAEDAGYLNTSLTGDNHIWKICSWHQIAPLISLGFHKDDSAPFSVYEECRRQGAIIVDGHNHTYTRTKTMIKFGTGSTPTQNIPDPQIDLSQHPKDANNIPQNPNNVVVASERLPSPGKTFVATVGTGGNSPNTYTDCEAQYPYGPLSSAPNVGCSNYIFAKVYSKLQVNNPTGAMFITFNVNGDPNMAQGYFKDIAGNTIDTFTITKR